MISDKVIKAINEGEEVSFPFPKELMPWMDKFGSSKRRYSIQLTFLPILIKKVKQMTEIQSDEKLVEVLRNLENIEREAYVLARLLNPLWKEIVYGPAYYQVKQKNRLRSEDIMMGSVWWLAIPYELSKTETILKCHPYAVVDKVEFQNFWQIMLSCRTSCKQNYTKKQGSENYVFTNGGIINGLKKDGLFLLDEIQYVVMIKDDEDYVSEFDLGRFIGKLPKDKTREIMKKYIQSCQGYAQKFYSTFFGDFSKELSQRLKLLLRVAYSRR